VHSAARRALLAKGSLPDATALLPKLGASGLAELLEVACSAPRGRFFFQLHRILHKACGAKSLCVADLDEAGTGFRIRYLQCIGTPQPKPFVDAEAARKALAADAAYLKPEAGIAIVPMRSNGNRIGYLAASTEAAGGFDASAMEWLRGAGNAASLVVAAELAADEAAARSEEIRLLLKTARALSSERDLEQLFERFYELVSAIMDASSFFVALGSWDDGQMTIPFAIDDNKRVHLGGRLPIEGSLTGHVFREGKPLIIRNLADFDAYPGFVRGEGEETKSALVVPMRIETRTIGVISVQTVAPDSYSERERDLLVAIAEQAAIAVENSQHLTSSEQRARELKLLAEVSRALSTQLSLRELYQTVCAEVRRVMDAPVFMVALRAEDAGTMRLEYCMQEDTEVEFGEYSLENSIAKRVIELNQPVVLQTKADLDSTPHRFLKQDDKSIRSVAMAPLRVADQCIGVMSAQSYRDGAFDDSSVRLLTAIGEQMALAVQNAKLFREARNRADRDPLTNVFHHRYLKTRLEEELARAGESNQPFAILMLDLDNFKLVNDTYGHLIGDEALRLVTAVLHGICRTSDVIGRYGGDEFMVILPETTAPQAIHIADRIDWELASQTLRVASSAIIPLHCSIGLAAYPRDGNEASDLIAKADAALYQSKRQGLPMARLQRVGQTQMRLEGNFAPVSELLAALLARDPATRSHLEHVNRLAQEFAAILNLSQSDRESLLLASVLHDIGKIAIPDQILRKPGVLSDLERELVQRHPIIGSMLIEHIPGFADAATAVRHHHERYDGTGYPEGLAGDAIPLAARIVTLTDAFSAMTVDRPYHKGMKVAEAVAELRRCAGTQFCPWLVEEFAKIVEGGGGR
jgi:diguanylate cyclase (GGDEF)-like protein